MTTALVRTQENPQQALQRILEVGKQQIAVAVGNAMSPERMIRLAVTALHTSPQLQNCSMVSIANSVMLAAQLRLEINTGLGHAWLIPYKGQCSFQIGYRGLIELAHRSSEVHDVNAHVVYANDQFDLEYGDSPSCVHIPVTKGERGDWVGAYATIRYEDGPPSSLYMPRIDIEAVRDKSSQSKDSDYGPWKRFADEMIRKTPTKRLLKYVRLSVNDMARAIGLDDQAEAATSDDAPERKNDPARISQELVLDPSLLDMAEEAGHELRGSAAMQEEVKEEQIQKLRHRTRRPAPEPVAVAEPVGQPGSLTDEEKFNALSPDKRRTAFGQLAAQLGDKYREVVDGRRGVLNYETFQILSVAVDVKQRQEGENE